MCQGVRTVYRKEIVGVMPSALSRSINSEPKPSVLADALDDWADAGKKPIAADNAASAAI